MPGARYEGWHHTRFEGDVDAAKALLPLARKVLGYAVQQAQVSGLLTYKYVYRLENGGHVIGEINGGIPRVTIYVPPVAGGGPRPLEFNDFVVWARTTDIPDGIDEEHPQQILRPAWKTVFFDDQIEGYDEFDGKKGVYAPIFPDGVRRAGNVDWVNKIGVRISWYGPSSRYFCDPFRQPRDQYGKHVFMLGRSLLDVDQYIADSSPDAPFSARYVMGAALSPSLGELYVVLADLPFGNTIGGTVPGNTIAFPETWPLADVPMTVCRFSVISVIEPVGAPRFEVTAGSREVLLAMTLRNAYNPWFFNASATQAVSVGLPEFTRCVTPNDGVSGLPSPNSPVWTATIDEDSAEIGATTTSLAAAAGSLATVALDFKGNTLVSLDIKRGPVGNASADGFSYVLGGLELPCRERDSIAPTVGRVTQRYIQHADLREGELVVLRLMAEQNFSTATTLESEAQIEVWVKGVRTGAVDLDLFDVLGCGVGGQFISPNEDWRGATAGAALTPHFALYGSIGGTDFVAVFIRWTGNHGGYRYLGFPEDQYFSDFAVYPAGPGGPRHPMSDSRSGEFDGDRADFDGKLSNLACATYEGRTMFSGPAHRSGTGESVSLVCGPDGVELPVLTGVDGEKVRYHPIWLLGAIPNRGTS